MTVHRFVPFAIVLPMLLFVGGCSATGGATASPEGTPTAGATAVAGATPSSTPIATPTPTATATAAASLATSVQISGSSVRVLGKNGKTLAAIDYTARPKTAIAAIDAALGQTAALTTTAERSCQPSVSLASWGTNLTLSYGKSLVAPGKAKFVIIANEAKTQGGAAIVTPDGWGVGARLAVIIKADPATQHEKTSTHTQAVFYDIAHGTAADQKPFGSFYGAYATSRDGSITQLESPAYYYRDC